MSDKEIKDMSPISFMDNLSKRGFLANEIRHDRCLMFCTQDITLIIVVKENLDSTFYILNSENGLFHQAHNYSEVIEILNELSESDL